MRFSIRLLAALTAWSVTVTCAATPAVSSEAAGTCSEGLSQLGKKLSKSAKIYCPGSAEFEKATTRWSVLEAPKVNIVVVPGTEEDVIKTVKYANSKDLPFLAYNTAHGAITTLGRMDHGVEIYLNQLNKIEVAADGKTATIGGGTQSKKVTDTLWAANKQTVTGTCECVSYMGPGLGGGHGWLQGHHGIIADQWVSLNIVMADGSLKTIDNKSDLWWALKGAGHNFGIVTSITSKVYEIQHRDWAIETLVFSGEHVEKLYQTANEYLLRKQPEGLINWSYWVHNPDADPENPVILFWLIQEGVKTIDPKISKPFHDLKPIAITPESGDYRDLARWTQIDIDAAPCQKSGLVNPRFPLYLQEYNVTAMKNVWDLFAVETGPQTPFNTSIFMFEGYSTQAVRGTNDRNTAFAFRHQDILTAPLITYKPGDTKLDQKAAQIGNELRQILHRASGQSEMSVYVNYAYGNEEPVSWYGNEGWRQDRLKSLKNKYDPKGKFSFFGPVA
ncbi:related to oxidoreductase [Fusarium torulosum]|uniref:Related to oxidoreductase n=1 Tax=Fusarium torulosum TaxID=33205 RepID=A0AAE8SGD0_9HYPO|nr:related to oxidoreductase [Fusarium torulosum]